jgi:hypothetical protein
MAFIEMSVEMSQTTIRIGELAEDDIVDLVYCTRVIAKSRIDITGAIDEPFVYRNEWHYITRERARPRSRMLIVEPRLVASS